MNADDGIVWFLRASERDLGSAVVLTVEGRVSNATVGDLAGWLKPRGRGVKGLVLDLSGVDYVNGAGVQALAAAATALRAAGSELIACGLRPVVRTSFDIAGPIPDLTIEPSVDAAVRRLQST